MQRTTYILAICTASLNLVALGCAKQPELAEVTGKVTLNGKPLNNVRVDFHPDTEKGTTGPGSTGTTDNEGNFTLAYIDGKRGAAVGFHRVIVTDLDVFGTVLVGRGDYRTDSPDGPKETSRKARFPEIYANLADTPFKLEVKPGMDPVDLAIKK